MKCNSIQYTKIHLIPEGGLGQTIVSGKVKCGELENFDVEKDLSKFLISLINSAQAIFPGMFDQETAETQLATAFEDVLTNIFLYAMIL